MSDLLELVKELRFKHERSILILKEKYQMNERMLYAMSSDDTVMSKLVDSYQDEVMSITSEFCEKINELSMKFYNDEKSKLEEKYGSGDMFSKKHGELLNKLTKTIHDDSRIKKSGNPFADHSSWFWR